VTRRARVVLVGAGIALLLLALLVRLMLQPQRFTRTLLDRTGRALGLEITAGGIGEYRLRGTPMLVVRKVLVREPGAATPLLSADRILLSLPWSTIRARGSELNASRIELDAPHLDLPALQHWLATRPKRETRIPTLTNGLRITGGRIVNDNWSIDGIDAALPSLVPGQPVNAHVKGRYLDPPTTVAFDVAVALTRPANDVGLALIGPVAIARDNWRLPARIKLTGMLHLGDDNLRLTPARLAMSARYQARDTDLPFLLGLYGPLLFDEATWSLAPAGVALRGGDVLPDLDARGALALGRRLVLQLQGRMAEWPEAWPTLPPPIGQSTSSLAFALDYAGKPDLSEVARLRLQRDATRFDGSFRAFDVMAWTSAREQDSLLPPLDATITTPRMEVAGAQLEGVEITLDDPLLEEGQQPPGSAAP
jgi:hypothetical protein